MESQITEKMRSALKNFNEKNFIKSKSEFEEILKIDAKCYQAIFNIGIIEINLGNNLIGQDSIEKAFKINKTKAYALALIDALILNKNFKKAEDLLKKNNQLFKKIDENLNILEKIHFQKSLHSISSRYNDMDNENNIDFLTSLYEDAKEHIKKYQNDNIGFSIKGSVLLKISSIKNNLDKNYDEICSSLMQSLEIDKNNISIYNTLGLLHKKHKDQNKSIEILKKGIEIFSESSDLLFNLGNVYLFDNKDYELAENCFVKALELKPSDLDISINLGKVYKETKKYSYAIKIYKNIIKLYKSKIDGYLGMSAIKLLQGEVKGAKKYIDKAFEIDPSDEKVRQNLSIFLLRSGQTNEGVKLIENTVGTINFNQNDKFKIL